MMPPETATVCTGFCVEMSRDVLPSIRSHRQDRSGNVPGDTGFQFGHLMVEDLEVVGVVSDARYRSLAQPPEPAMYVSSEQFIDRRRTG